MKIKLSRLAMNFDILDKPNIINIGLNLDINKIRLDRYG